MPSRIWLYHKNGILVIVLSMYSILFLMYKWCHYIQSNIITKMVVLYRIRFENLAIMYANAN